MPALDPFSGTISGGAGGISASDDFGSDFLQFGDFNVGGAGGSAGVNYQTLAIIAAVAVVGVFALNKWG